MKVGIDLYCQVLERVREVHDVWCRERTTMPAVVFNRGAHHEGWLWWHVLSYVMPKTTNANAAPNMSHHD